jgi:hypothetical protein
MEQQKLSIFQDFLASLPPAARELLQLIYDSNNDLTHELAKRKAEIKQLRQVGVGNSWQAMACRPDSTARKHRCQTRPAT